MMFAIHEIKEALWHLVFPHICAGCGSDYLNKEGQLCLRCLSTLPRTNFQEQENNPVEKIFWGRLPVVAATAQFSFVKDSLMQQLLHQFKYKGNKELGLQLGRMMGKSLLQSHRFQNIHALIALPLFPTKEKKRGFNQAEILCEGIAEKMNLPIYKNAILRPSHTETQTKKKRIERWENMEGKFLLANESLLQGKHVLLVDDVVTTGATLESCGTELLRAEKLKLSIATLCYAEH